MRGAQLLMRCLAIIALALLVIEISRGGDHIDTVDRCAAYAAGPLARFDRFPNLSISPAQYNCAGLAFRTYRYMSLEETQAILAHCQPLESPETPVPAGWLKIWYWSYDLHHETDDGQADPPHPDGHLVSGLTDPTDGTGPFRVYCKFATGPVLGPAKPERWAPPARELVGTNVTGHRVYAIRDHITQRLYCAPLSVVAALAN